MAGNAHASRHGHRMDCNFCKAARQKIADIYAGRSFFTGHPNRPGAGSRFIANCKPFAQAQNEMKY